jgi:hypothetical protein
MVVDNDEINRKIKSAQSSITSLSIFIALSVAVIGLLLSRPSVEFGYNAIVVSSVSLTFAIVVFLFALEFFILCIYHCEHIDGFGLVGSCLYALGVMFMIVGISVGIVAFGIKELSFIFLSFAFFGYLVYYILRVWKLGREDNFKTRMAFRSIHLFIIAVGYVFVATVGG